MKEREQLKQAHSDISHCSVFEQGSIESLSNISGFMSLLMKINEREQIVPTKQKE